MHGKAIWKPGIRVIAKASSGISRKPYNGDLQHPIWTPSCKGPTCWRTGYGAWLVAVKLNPLWKTKVSISAWIKPCCPMSLFCITNWGLELFSLSHFQHDFWRKTFVTLHSTNQQNWLVWLSDSNLLSQWLPLLLDIWQNVYYNCSPVPDALNFEIKLSFLITPGDFSSPGK